jgi:hypothetical protein
MDDFDKKAKELDNGLGEIISMTQLYPILHPNTDAEILAHQEHISSYMVSLREFITLQMQEVRRLRIENSELKRRLSNLGFNDTDAVSSE